MLLSIIIISAFILFISLIAAFIGDNNSTLVAIFGAIIGIVFVFVGIKLALYFRKEAKLERARDRSGYKIYPKQWFLRWYAPDESEYDMLKDREEYIKDKIKWETHNKLRAIYLEGFVSLDNETGLSYADELYNYYTKNTCSEKYLKLIRQMESSGVTLVYRPEVDYLAFGGPIWADCPERSETNIYPEEDRIFIITKDNINNVVMDHKKYYKDKYIKEGINMKDISNST